MLTITSHIRELIYQHIILGTSKITKMSTIRSNNNILSSTFCSHPYFDSTIISKLELDKTRQKKIYFHIRKIQNYFKFYFMLTFTLYMRWVNFPTYHFWQLQKDSENVFHSVIYQYWDLFFCNHTYFDSKIIASTKKILGIITFRLFYRPILHHLE